MNKIDDFLKSASCISVSVVVVVVVLVLVLVLVVVGSVVGEFPAQF